MIQNKIINGIHHITALAGDPQINLDFYTGVLGLRLIKKTVNFDAPEVYHFYYGFETADIGAILTFFPYESISKGRIGAGMVTAIAFSVAASSLDYWMDRLQQFNVKHERPQERFDNETILFFKDPDGLSLELVFNNRDRRTGFTYGHIPGQHAIKGFYHAEVLINEYDPTAQLLTEQMDHHLLIRHNNRYRFAATDLPGNYVDILHIPDQHYGIGGAGTVHHIAFGTANNQTQKEARRKITEYGMDPTPVIDRQYFKSVYFRESGGVLFEIATDGPGFEIDEPAEHLGGQLRLPPQYEPYRKQIEKSLKPVQLNLHQYADA